MSTVIKPTCTDKGYTLHKCSVCGKNYKDAYTNATGHKWDAGKITKAATCLAEGVKTYTCTVCHIARTESIAKSGHKYVATIIKPTCVEEGCTRHSCIYCNSYYVDTFTKRTDHDIYDTGIVTEATDYALGVKTFKCRNCRYAGKYEYAKKHTIDIGNGQTSFVYGYWDKNAGDKVFQLLNEYRKQNGLSLLLKEDNLSQMAMIRAAETAKRFSHVRPNGEMCFTAYTGSNIKAAAENIAAGQETPEEVMISWKESSGHNANMLDKNLQYGAVGCFVQIFYTNGDWSISANEHSVQTPWMQKRNVWVQNFASFW